MELNSSDPVNSGAFEIAKTLVAVVDYNRHGPWEILNANDSRWAIPSHSETISLLPADNTWPMPPAKEPHPVFPDRDYHQGVIMTVCEDLQDPYTPEPQELMKMMNKGIKCIQRKINAVRGHTYGWKITCFDGQTIWVGRGYEAALMIGLFPHLAGELMLNLLDKAGVDGMAMGAVHVYRKSATAPANK